MLLMPHAMPIIVLLLVGGGGVEVGPVNYSPIKNRHAGFIPSMLAEHFNYYIAGSCYSMVASY